MVKNSPDNAGEAELIPGSGRSPGGGYGQPTPVFLPGNTMDKGVFVTMRSQRVGHDLVTK